MVYIARDRLAAWRAGTPDPIRWIVISIHGIPDWASEGEVPATGVPFRTTDAEAQFAAVRQGLGITALPCFMADADPLLVRVPGAPLHKYGAVWLLTHGETRKTKRVQLFTAFLSRRLAALRAASRGPDDLAWLKQRSSVAQNARTPMPALGSLGRYLRRPSIRKPNASGYPGCALSRHKAITVLRSQRWAGSASMRDATLSRS